MGKKIDLNNYSLEEIDGYSLAIHLAGFDQDFNLKVLHLGLNLINNSAFFDILNTL